MLHSTLNEKRPLRLKYYCYSSLTLCLAVWLVACSNTSQRDVTITNPSTFDQKDAIVVINRKDLEDRIGTIPNGKFASVFTRSQQPLAVQYDDLDGNGNWDELCFLYSFKAKENVQFAFAVTDARAAVKAVVRAHVRHRKKNAADGFEEVIIRDTMPDGNPPTDFAKVPLPPYLTEGPAWENDKVAFRLYFDTRNGKDVFGKLVPGMVMDTIGVNQNNSYHEFSGWGMDLLHVGKSLGAGSIAFAIKNTLGKDTLVRLGGPHVKNQTYEMIADGPVRAIFRINYDWVLNGQRVHITDETSIWGGQYFYESKLTVNGAPEDAKLVAGIADFYDNRPGEVHSGRVSIYYSYGPQSEHKDNLGLGILVTADSFAGHSRLTDSTNDIRDSYLVAQKIKEGEPSSYRFYSCWEKSDQRFATEAGIKRFFQGEAASFSNPLIVKW